LLARNLIKIIFGKKRRDELFANRYITNISFLRKIRKSPLLVKNLDGLFWCRPNDTDSVMISDRHEDFLREKYVLKKGDIIFDIGAHIGKYAIRAANLVGKEGKVYAIEIEPKTYEFLLKNIQLNKFEDRIIPRKIAISNKVGKSAFFISETRSEINSLHDDWGKKIEVDTTTIDEIVKKEKLNKIDLVQMDIQGAEYEAILGAKDSIQEGIVKKFIIETHSKKNFELLPPLLEAQYNVEIFQRTGPDFGYLICELKH
jgi:FkbM family methyltransferase